ncbi:hypothetical protein BJ742DRAFT_116757 [Cladochytrium replicatum]|nr:hypothetical protein BJ742DRAFT_116757 [Cladochytrium replicatum]
MSLPRRLSQKAMSPISQAQSPSSTPLLNDDMNNSQQQDSAMLVIIITVVVVAVFALVITAIIILWLRRTEKSFFSNTSPLAETRKRSWLSYPSCPPLRWPTFRKKQPTDPAAAAAALAQRFTELEVVTTHSPTPPPPVPSVAHPHRPTHSRSTSGSGSGSRSTFDLIAYLMPPNPPQTTLVSNHAPNSQPHMQEQRNHGRNASGSKSTVDFAAYLGVGNFTTTRTNNKPHTRAVVSIDSMVRTYTEPETEPSGPSAPPDSTLRRPSVHSSTPAVSSLNPSSYHEPSRWLSPPESLAADSSMASWTTAAQTYPSLHRLSSHPPSLSRISSNDHSEPSSTLRRNANAGTFASSRVASFESGTGQFFGRGPSFESVRSHSSSWSIGRDQRGMRRPGTPAPSSVSPGRRSGGGVASASRSPHRPKLRRMPAFSFLRRRESPDVDVSDSSAVDPGLVHALDAVFAENLQRLESDRPLIFDSFVGQTTVAEDKRLGHVRNNNGSDSSSIARLDEMCERILKADANVINSRGTPGW